MIPLLGSAACRALDEDATARLGLPGAVLMENAGKGAYDTLLRAFCDRLARCVVVCGPGQNGGDGWVVARHLFAGGQRPLVVLLGDPDRLPPDASQNYAAARAMGVDIQVLAVSDAAELGSALVGASLVVDALFGTGLGRPLEGGYAQAVLAMDACEAPVVALDLPSGVCADTGQVLGLAPHASMTITFAAHKRGLYQFPGAAHVGRVRWVSIGVPPPDLSEVGLMTAGWAASRLRPRPADAHKGSAGHVWVIGGSEGKSGAALLAGMGAMRAGAGLVTIATRAAARAELEGEVLELMTEALPEDSNDACEWVMARASGMRAAVLGPGLGLDEAGAKLALCLAEQLPIPMVLDADALTAIAAGPGLRALRHAAGPRVLTPHPGEAARLVGGTVESVQVDRYGAARRLSEESKQVVALKGARTIVSAGAVMAVCPRGTPALAVAGTGDVLAGVIGGLLATLPAPEAAQLGVYLHACAGELAATADRGLLAREVADHMPKALAHCASLG